VSEKWKITGRKILCSRRLREDAEDEENMHQRMQRKCI
jgi:hypothetical protein